MDLSAAEHYCAIKSCMTTTGDSISHKQKCNFSERLLSPPRFHHFCASFRIVPANDNAVCNNDKDSPGGAHSVVVALRVGGVAPHCYLNIFSTRSYCFFIQKYSNARVYLWWRCVEENWY